MKTEFKSYFRTALGYGIFLTSRKSETRRNDNHWHAPLRTSDTDARAALALGQVVRNVEQGFDALPAGPRFINVRFTSSS